MSQSTVGDNPRISSDRVAAVAERRAVAGRSPVEEPSRHQINYEFVYRVMERVDRARSLPDFKVQVVEALSSVMGFGDVSFFAGPTFHSIFSDPHPVVGGKTAGMLESYQENWYRHDLFSTSAAARMLRMSGAASLPELKHLPAVTTASGGYIRHFLNSQWGMKSAAALEIDLFGLHTGLIGIFTSDPQALGPNEMATLRALGRQLSAVARGIPFVPLRHDCSQLTPRQREVAHLVAEGLSNSTIADVLFLAEDSVKKYVSRILTNFDCSTRMELALMIRSGPCSAGSSATWGP